MTKLRQSRFFRHIVRNPRRFGLQFFVLLVFIILIFSTAYFVIPFLVSSSYEDGTLSSVAEAIPMEKEVVVRHLPIPPSVKAIYMTSCVAGTTSFRNSLVKLIDETEINAVVIDIKDFTGKLSFIRDNPELSGAVSKNCFAPDMEEFVKSLHEKGIYVIGRITVFQDPHLVKERPELAVKRKSDGGIWKDYKGLNFTDPGSKEVWDYIVTIGKESYDIGFDELNFDYIRFPSDGNMKDIVYPWSGNRQKSEVLREFFVYLNNNLKPTGVVLSADLFGMTTTNTDDLNIGQVLENTLPYFDYVAPMVYPSHYPPNFNGWANPNKYPYEVVKFSLDSAVRRAMATSTVIALSGVAPISTTTKPFLYKKRVFDAQKIRPWLQDFDYGGNYDVTEVQAQIKAVYDAGLDSWMLWNAGNKYTKDALLPE